MVKLKNLKVLEHPDTESVANLKSVSFLHSDAIFVKLRPFGRSNNRWGGGDPDYRIQLEGPSESRRVAHSGAENGQCQILGKGERTYEAENLGGSGVIAPQVE